LKTSVPPTFRWDEEKRRIDPVRHGLDFANVKEFEWETAIVAGQAP
jgi:uncharacterized DUF497 family protein